MGIEKRLEEENIPCQAAAGELCRCAGYYDYYNASNYNADQEKSCVIKSVPARFEVAEEITYF